jgi:hypothetical protein
LNEKSKAQEIYLHMASPPIFALEPQEKLFCQTLQKAFFLCKEAAFREDEAEAKVVLVGAVPKGP